MLLIRLLNAINIPVAVADTMTRRVFISCLNMSTLSIGGGGGGRGVAKSPGGKNLIYLLFQIFQWFWSINVNILLVLVNFNRFKSIL